MFTVERNDISANLQWYSINGTSGLKQVTIFSILTPVILRDQLWNQHIKVVPGAILYVSGLKNLQRGPKQKKSQHLIILPKNGKRMNMCCREQKLLITINTFWPSSMWKTAIALYQIQPDTKVYYITFQDR